MKRRERVLLIQPPFAPFSQPSCALGRLKASLRAQHIHCECDYPNLDLFTSLDEDVRQWLSKNVRGMTYAELIYSSAMFPDYVSKRRYVRAMRFHYDDGRRDHLNVYMKLFRQTHRFNRNLIDRWKRGFPYTIVGISANYNLMPALFCCSVLKKLYPSIQTVFGGSECTGEIGHALARKFSFIDWVVDGEGEKVLPEIVKIIERRSDEIPAGTCRRFRGSVVVNSTPRKPIDIESLPCPDYDDFFHSSSLKKLNVPIMLPIESGRGCWWGRCSFCNSPCRGRNLYRRVSDKCVLKTMEHLADRYKNLSFMFVDPVQPTNVESLAMSLIGSPYDFSFFMPFRTNIPVQHLNLFKRAGLKHGFFGVESFSDNLLQKMNKGTTVIDNILTLRAAKQLGIRALFHIIHGHPGEQLEDRKTTSKTMRHICHLINGLVSEGPFALLYRSDVYYHPKKYHIKGMTIDPPFLPPAFRFTPTYYWDCSPKVRKSEIVPPSILKGEDGGSLELHVGGKTFCIVEDRRSTSKSWKDYVLTSPHSDILISCLTPRRRNELRCKERVLQDLIRRGLLIESSGRYLTLATRNRSDTE